MTAVDSERSEIRHGTSIVERQPSNVDVSIALTLFTLLVCAAFVISYFRGLIFGHKYPYDTFLPSGSLWRVDALRYWQMGISAPEESFGTAIWKLPVARVLPTISDSISMSPIAGYLGSLLIFCGAGIYAVCLILRRRGPIIQFVILVFVLSCYPSMLLFQSGNPKLHAFALLMCAAVAAQRHQWGRYAVWVGIACSLSPITFLFLFLPLHDKRLSRRWDPVVKGLCIAVSLNVVALLVLPTRIMSSPLIRVVELSRKILADYQSYLSRSEFNPIDLMYSHGIVTTVETILGPKLITESVWPIGIFVAGVILSFGILMRYAKSGAPLSRSWIFIAASTCLYTPLSSDVNLFLIVPGIIILLADESHSPRHLLIIVATILICVPKPWGYVGWYPWANANIWLTSLLLVGLSLPIHRRKSIEH